MVEIRERNRQAGFKVFESGNMRPRIILEKGGVDGGCIVKIVGATAKRLRITGRFGQGGIETFINGHFHPSAVGAAAGFRRHFSDILDFLPRGALQACANAFTGRNKGRGDQG